MSATITIREATTDEEIGESYPVMRQLRPHVPEADYVSTVQRMMVQGYRLITLYADDEPRAAAGFRIFELLHRGVALYVDDLVTDEGARSSGYGRRLLDWLEEEGRRTGCTQVHLDSGVQRRDAHRFYFRERMAISSFHFERPIEP